MQGIYFEKRECCEYLRFMMGKMDCVDERRMQVHPITAVEIEISPWSYGDEVKDGKYSSFRQIYQTDDIFMLSLVIATSAELGISVIAYS